MLNLFKQSLEIIRTSLIGMKITGRYLKPGTEVTREYPETPVLTFERTRGRMNVTLEKCTACTLCAKTCPVECITIETEKKLEGKGKRAVRFVIDFSRCMFCGLCVEACPTRALHHTRKCDFSSFEREALVEDFGLGFYSGGEEAEAQRDKGTEVKAGSKAKSIDHGEHLSACGSPAQAGGETRGEPTSPLTSILSPRGEEETSSGP